MMKFSSFFCALGITVAAVFNLNGQTNGQIDNMRSDTIDVLNYQMNVDLLQMSNSIFKASCKVSFESKMDNVDGISLDLLELTIDSIRSGSNTLNYHYNDTLIRVDLPNVLNAGDQEEVTVYYHGTPQLDPSGFGGFYFTGNFAYNLGVAFDGEPHNYGRTWHPCFDNFVERATYDIEITTPQNITAYSNGYIESESIGTNNENIRRWKMDEGIPTYLACIGAAPYTHVDQTFTSSLTNAQTPVMLIAKPQDTTSLKNSFVNLFGAMDAYESNYGPYEWNKIAFALVPFNGGAMEHSTCVMYPDFAVDGSLNYETLMAHELSHHWWGNLVTCRTAEDMWINEGLASYSESIFLEHVYDYDRYIEELKSVHRDVIQSAHFRDGGFLSISGVPHNATYGMHTYSKGATLMHNLRTHMGDADFFSGLKAIQTDYAFGNINAEEFRDKLTASTGYDATSFFDNYVFNPGFNAFEINGVVYDTHNTNIDARVSIQQKLFEAPDYFDNVPVEITFVDDNWNTYTVTELVSGAQQYVDVNSLPFAPVMVYLNKNSKLLNAVTGQDYTITEPTTEQGNYSYFYLRVLEENDSSFVRVEHYRVAADDLNQLDGDHEYVLSPDRYWKVDGIFSESFEAEGRIFYDARNTAGGNLDVGLMQDHGGVAFHEDSLVLLFRPSQGALWSEYDDYELYTQGNLTDGYGRIEITNIRKGEYAFGFRKSALNTSSEKLPNDFKIYPNPVKHNIQIEWEDAGNSTVVEITDSNGKSISKHKMKNKALTISVDDLSKGVYFIAVYDKKQLLGKQKMIKE
ncbi:M1 family aminopeptidase [Brumimicrobium aurantiacum]|uniref:Aminopeptidase N n=1 Tax=Brumimicrobium aurantiacum TaxID=1737063 RepID=A0A3E1EVZ5_9FLAO|nr:M1 family aminopeptidase [Brumimicrobium aurantiacum]RFC53730.1 T9SS C-terminal target domain-containing protein [Brumimicrobium aurantiacum]